MGTTYIPLPVPQRLLTASWLANQAKYLTVSGKATIPDRNNKPAPWGWVTNITGTATTAATTLSMYSLGSPPAAVDLTIGKGRTVSNTTIARIQFNGDYLYNKAGTTNVILDAFGWFG